MCNSIFFYGGGGGASCDKLSLKNVRTECKSKSLPTMVVTNESATFGYVSLGLSTGFHAVRFSVPNANYTRFCLVPQLI